MNPGLGDPFPTHPPTKQKFGNSAAWGTSLKIAINVGLNRKGPWRLARTLATHTGMTNQWFKDQGLLSVKELWVYPVEFPEGNIIQPG
jgi:hypothetical protein